MTDIAPLGFEIDTRPLERAKIEGAAAAAALTKVADATDAVAQKQAVAAQAVQRTAVAYQQQAGATTQASAGVNKYDAEISRLRADIERLTGALQAQTTATQQQAAATQQGTSGITAALTQFGTVLGTVNPRLGFMANSVAMNIAQFRQLQGAAGGVTAAMGQQGAGGAVGGLGGFLVSTAGKALLIGGAIVLLVTKLWDMARAAAEAQDRWAGYDARLRLATGSTVAAAAALDSLYAASQRTGTPVQATIDSFTRLARSSESIGLTNKEILDLTETVQKLGIVSGASAGELSSAMLQFSQALASGRLQGDELRSIMENMPALAAAIAKGLGITVGQIREMGASGQLTARDISMAVIRNKEEVDKQFAQMPDSVERAHQRMVNSFDRLKAKISETLHLSEGFRFIYNTIAAAADAQNRAMGGAKPDAAAQEIAQLEARLKRLDEIIKTRTSMRKFFAYEDRDNRAAEMERDYTYMALQGAKARAQEKSDKEFLDEMLKPAIGARQQGTTVADQLIEAENKAKGLKKQIDTLVSAQQALGTLLEQERITVQEFWKEWERAALAIDIARQQLEKLGDPLRDLREEMATITRGREQGLTGGALDIFAQVEKARKQARENNVTFNEQGTTDALVQQNIEKLRQQIDAKRQDVEASDRQVAAIGRGNKAMDAARIEGTLAALAMQLFGKSLAEIEVTPGMEKVADYFKTLRDWMEREAENQRKLAGAGFIQGLQDQLKALQAQEKTVALGPYAVRQAEAIANAEKSRREHGERAYQLELKIFETRERLQALTRLANIEAERGVTRAALNARLDPRAIREARTEADIQREAREFAPEKRAEFIAARRAQERDNIAASLREEAARMQKNLDLQQEEYSLARLVGEEYEAQKARLDQKRQLLQAGYDIEQPEAKLQIDLAEAIARGNYELERRREALGDIRNGFREAGREVFSTIGQMVNRLLEGTKLSAKEATELIRGMVARVAQNIIENVLIKPVERAATRLLEQLGNWVANNLGKWLGLGSGPIGGIGSGGGGVTQSMPIGQGAHGAVFGPGGVEYFRRGGIFDTPTYFRFGGGRTGQMGEAGPEGILPLRRDGSGNLGVMASGGVSIVVNDMRSAQGSQPVETEERKGPDGRTLIRVTVRDEVRRGMKAGEYDQEMGSQFNIGRRLVRR